MKRRKAVQDPAPMVTTRDQLLGRAWFFLAASPKILQLKTFSQAFFYTLYQMREKCFKVQMFLTYQVRCTCV